MSVKAIGIAIKRTLEGANQVVVKKVKAKVKKVKVKVKKVKVKVCNELQTKKGKQAQQGLTKELIQGKLIWPEANQNKNALIISKHACESRSIKQSQDKATMQVIKRHNTQERTDSGSNAHTGYICHN
ncbi:hypothetical protein Fmac_008330 [Flemingia macrophylla]|uniref:Uncharacterized protein n=1 Tax=Flemingia macrophylla TaxID=520843 RepID=A0ABD1MX48_9FABA